MSLHVCVRAFKKVKVKSESCSVVSNSLQLRGLHSPWNSPGHNTGVGSLVLLQGIFPTQGLNPGLLHCRRILYQLSHKGNPRMLQWVAYPFSVIFLTQESNWSLLYCRRILNQLSSQGSPTTVKMRPLGWALTHNDWSPQKKRELGHGHMQTKEVTYQPRGETSDETNPANSLILNCEKINFCCLTTQSMVLCYVSPGKQIQPYCLRFSG